MASPGDLVKAMAEALSMPEASVTVHDRNLVIAGLRSKSGRGLNAAKITARDAAHLLTAILASALVKDSVHSVSRYLLAVPDATGSSAAAFAGLGISELAALPAAHSFIDALEALIQSAASGSLRKLVKGDGFGKSRQVPFTPTIEVAAMTPGTVGDIRISGTGRKVSRSIRYRLPDPWLKPTGRRPKDTEIDAWSRRIEAHRIDSDLEQYRRVSEKTILRVAELIAPTEEP